MLCLLKQKRNKSHQTVPLKNLLNTNLNLHTLCETFRQTKHYLISFNSEMNVVNSIFLVISRK